MPEEMTEAVGVGGASKVDTSEVSCIDALAEEMSAEYSALVEYKTP